MLLTKTSAMVFITIVPTDVSVSTKASSVLPAAKTKAYPRLTARDAANAASPKSISLPSVFFSAISFFRLIPFCLYSRIAEGRRMIFTKIRIRQYTFGFAVA